MKNGEYIVVDVETANKDVSSICQIGLVYVSNGHIIAKKRVFLNPEVIFDSMNINIHKITARNVEGKLSFPQIFNKLQKILLSCPIYQHSDFDRSAINAVCKKYNLPSISADWRNTIPLFQQTWPNLSAESKLKSLCKHFEIEFKHHDALEDAQATAHLISLALTGAKLPTPKLNSYPKKSNKFGDEIFVITGDTQRPKIEIIELATSHGFKYHNRMIQKATYLILGETSQRTIDADNEISSKHKDALELKNKGHNIEILKENEFLKLLDM